MILTDEQIQQYLNNKCVPHCLKGYLMLVEGIRLAAENRRSFTMGMICDEIARWFETTPSRVERAMRHAIGRSSDKCQSREFIAKAADELLLVYDNHG